VRRSKGVVSRCVWVRSVVAVAVASSGQGTGLRRQRFLKSLACL